MWMFFGNVLNFFFEAQLIIGLILLELIRLPVELLSVILGNCPDRV